MISTVEIQQIEALVDQATIVPISETPWLRSLNRVLPLNDRWYGLIKQYAQEGGLVSVPWDEHCQLVFPGRWLSPMATWYIFEGRHHIPEFDVLAKLLPTLPQGTLVDVGGNLGYYLFEFRRYSSAPIISYEPVPFLYALLKKNVELNKLPNVEVRNRACGKVREMVPMNVGINSHVLPESAATEAPVEMASNFNSLADLHTAWTQARVQVVRLDEDLADVDQIALLKIDCEGFEYNVLQGAMNILQTKRPHLFIELHPVQLQIFDQSVKDVFDLLRPYYDFQLWDFQWNLRSNRFQRLLSRYLPTQGYRFQTEQEAIDLLAAGKLGTFHLLATPRK